MRDPVRTHHSGASNLRVARVHLASEHLVERACARQNERCLDVLNDALAQTRTVRTDTDASSSDVRKRDGFLVRSARGGGDLARTAQALDALSSAYVRQRVVNLISAHDSIRLDPALGG